MVSRRGMKTVGGRWRFTWLDRQEQGVEDHKVMSLVGGASKPGQELCFGPKGCEAPLKGFKQRTALVTGCMHVDGGAR